MTNASPGVAVVATQLARTDRRALSQAWYSALHLTERAASARPRGTASAAAFARPSSAACGTVRAGATTAAPNARAPQRPRTATPAVERRRPPCAASRRVERAVERLVRRTPPVAAQTVAIDAGRVRLLVRHTGAVTRIVAVCAPELRDAVERALAHARFALAAAGTVVR